MIATAGLAALLLAALTQGEPDAAVQTSAPDAGAPNAGTSDAGAPAPDGDAETPALVPPRLLGEVHADYPPEARAAGVQGTVVLTITVDAAGTVTAAEVVEPIGHGLDEAARVAVLRARFAPAQRHGLPIPARIRFTYEFALPPPPPKPAAPPPPPAPVLPAAPPLPPDAVTDVTIRGRSTAQRLRESAEAVTVVDMQRARTESADLAEVLARVPGLSVRRSGGLGSYVRFAINGLTDEQIRFYVDGIPLDAAGFGLGVQTAPVTFIDRAEIYRGVVPIRFGSDNLGGALNLVTLEDVHGTHATGSLQLGSFGTMRLSLAGRHTSPTTGLFTGVNLFLDHADNDYPVDDVRVPNAQGMPIPSRVHLFHNAYDGHGAIFDVGLVDRPWAKRLLLRVFDTAHYNELQTNLVMSVPYGEARYWETAYGANLRYEQPRIAGSPFGVNLILAYTRRTTSFRDLSPWVYNWFGQQVRTRPRPGEVETPTDQSIWDDRLLARLSFFWNPISWQEVRVTIAPNFDDRTGQNRAAMGRDPLAGMRRYLTLTAGVEYQVDLLDRRVQSISLAKFYSYSLWAEETLPGDATVRRDNRETNFGVGEELRYRLNPAIWAKASYELTTRHPSPDEVFGDGVRTQANLALIPERSHNLNASITVDRLPTRAGELRSEVNLFFRQPANQIIFLPSAVSAIYDNVNDARSQGVEASAGWTAPGDHFVIDGNTTWQSFRNLSTTGTFGAFTGDRIPNRPWLFANLAARVQTRNLSVPKDELSLGYYLRYVHSYYRSWESLGATAFKQVIPTQLTQDLVLAYTVVGRLRQTFVLEADNITDAKAYDFYGLQRPGRAFYGKMTIDF